MIAVGLISGERQISWKQQGFDKAMHEPREEPVWAAGETDFFTMCARFGGEIIFKKKKKNNW